MVKKIEKSHANININLRSLIVAAYLRGEKLKDIAEKCNVNKNTVLKWVNVIRNKKETGEIQFKIPLEEKEIAEILKKLNLNTIRNKTKNRMPKKIEKYLYKQFANKNTGGKDNRSIRKVQAKAVKKFKTIKNLSISTIHRYTRRTFKKIKYRDIPLMTNKYQEERRIFAKYIKDNEIDYKNIFFTDEKQFELYYSPNKQNNQIRLTKLSKKKLSNNDEGIIKIVTKGKPKFTQKIMVAGGISYYGIGKLNFVIGTMDTCAYLQTLENFKNDIDRLNKKFNLNLMFQQDGASCHTSAGSLGYINKNLNLIENWPGNSPDLSPIEFVWSLMAQQLEGYSFKNLDELKIKIIYFWNRIPEEACQNYFNNCFEKINQINKLGITKLINKQGQKKLIGFKKIGKYNDIIENIVYNREKMEKVKEKKEKIHKKAIDKQDKMLKKLNQTTFKKLCEKSIKSIYFDECYDEVVKQKTKTIKDLKKKLENLEEMTLDEFFEVLEPKYKDKMICTNINQDIDSESTRIDEIIGKYFPKNELKEKKKLGIINKIKHILHSQKKRKRIRGIKKIKK